MSEDAPEPVKILAARIKACAPAEIVPLAQEIGLEVAGLLVAEHNAIVAERIAGRAPEEPRSGWGKTYAAIVEGGRACVRAELRSALPAGTVFLSLIGGELHGRYRNCPLDAWMSQLLLRRGASLDRECWFAQNAHRWMPDPWGLLLLKTHGLAGTYDSGFNWLGIFPAAGLDRLDPAWDAGYQSDYMSDADFPKLLSKMAKKRTVPPDIEALIFMFNTLSGTAPVLRMEWHPKANRLKKYFPRLSGFPAGFEKIFAVPGGIDEVLATPLKLFLGGLGPDELRALYFLGMAESAYVTNVRQAFYDAHPKEDLLPKDIWERL